MEEGMYRTMYPTSCTAPKFYGLPKIHKTSTPLRPIVTSRGSVTYGVAKVVAKILKPLVGKSPHHMQSTMTLQTRLGKLLSFQGYASVPIMLLHYSPLFP